MGMMNFVSTSKSDFCIPALFIIHTGYTVLGARLTKCLQNLPE